MRATGWHDESGSGVVSTPLGVLVFLMFLLLAVQVTLHLSILTRANALAFDAATAAARGEDCAVIRARVESLGSNWNARMPTCSNGPPNAVVRVTGRSPALVVEVIGGITGLNTIVRDVQVRTEELQ